MRGFLITLFSLVILTSFTFITIKVLAFGPEDSVFVTEYRPVLANNPFLRDVFMFHNDGEAKADYLGDRYSRIHIEIDTLEGIEPDQESLQKFKEKVEEITGKEVILDISDENIPSDTTVDDAIIESIITKYRDVDEFYEDTAILYILYVSTDLSNERLLGITHEEDAFIIYKETIIDLTSKVSFIADEYEYSTLLHEFGHQIGLKHTSDENCIMFAREEISEEPQIIGSEDDVVTRFCTDELVALEAIKRSL